MKLSYHWPFSNPTFLTAVMNFTTLFIITHIFTVFYNCVFSKYLNSKRLCHGYSLLFYSHTVAPNTNSSSPDKQNLWNITSNVYSSAHPVILLHLLSFSSILQLTDTQHCCFCIWDVEHHWRKSCSQKD